jgi:hypothetical protein
MEDRTDESTNVRNVTLKVYNKTVADTKNG